MLDWIFGSSKPKEEKKETAHKQVLKEEDAWAYDFIKQYFISPLWRNPLMNFIEQNCLVFEDSEENKFQYTKIFKEFVGLCGILIESILADTGISEQVLQLCICKGLSHKKDSKIFKQLLVCDNFLSFKSIMVAKNKQMEIQALKEIGGTQQAIQIDEKQLQRLEIEKAIAMSLAMEEKLKQQEDQELQQAIRMSQMEMEVQKVPQKEKKEEKSYLGDLPPLMVRNNQMNKTMQQWKEDEQKVVKQIEALKITQKKKEEEESSEVRKKRLMEQRELIKKKKMEQRQKQLDAFVQNKPNTQKSQQVSEQELERRRKVMQRLKEQLKD